MIPLLPIALIASAVACKKIDKARNEQNKKLAKEWDECIKADEEVINKTIQSIEALNREKRKLIEMRNKEADSNKSCDDIDKVILDCDQRIEAAENFKRAWEENKKKFEISKKHYEKGVM